MAGRQSVVKKVAVAVVAIAGVALQIVWAVALIAPVVYLVGAICMSSLSRTDVQFRRSNDL